VQRIDEQQPAYEGSPRSRDELDRLGGLDGANQAGQDAEDAAHETFLRLQRGLSGYDPERPFRRWLLSLAAHRAIDRLRRRRREQQLFDGAEDPALHADGGETPLSGELREELRRRVQAAIDTLPDRYRAPLVLRYYADLDYAAIGEILGVDANQVATLLFRGRRRLREALEPGTGDLS